MSDETTQQGLARTLVSPIAEEWRKRTWWGKTKLMGDVLMATPLLVMLALVWPIAKTAEWIDNRIPPTYKHDR